MSAPAPFVLLPYQQRWVADASPVKVCEKSRRIGLSWATACEAALLGAASKAAGGMDCWYVGYNKDMAQEFIRDCANWARQYQLAATEVEEEVLHDGDQDILTFVIKFASGFRVTALSSRPSNLRGKQGFVILDEAAFHDELAELLKAALALLMWGGRVAVVSTHDGVTNAFNELCEEVRAKKKPYSLHKITIDDALGEGLYQRICLVRGKEWSPQAQQAWRDELFDFYGDAADEELMCVPRQSGGAYINRALIEARMHDAPVVRLSMADEFTHWPEHLRVAEVADWCERELRPLLAQLDPLARHAFGEDFGRSGDLTVLVPMTLTQTLRRVVPFLVELRNVPFEQQKQIAWYIIDRLPRFMAGAFDARGNGQWLAEVSAQRYGAMRIHEVALSEKWYGEEMPPFKAAFEDDTLAIPRDADVLEDIRALAVINGVPKLGKAKTKRGGEQRHGDAAIALALAYFASRQEAAPVEWTPAPTKASRWSESDDDDDFRFTGGGVL